MFVRGETVLPRLSTTEVAHLTYNLHSESLGALAPPASI